MSQVDLSELERYMRIYQENPDSRVFAPLADLYRRLGRLDEAEEICRAGINRHPYYAGGRVALAHVLFEKGNLKAAFKEIDAVVAYYPDNLLARKILIKVLAGMSQKDRAIRELETLKLMAPQVASDPELREAIEGPSPEELAQEEKRRQRALHLISLKRKKIVLEKLLETMEHSERISI